MKIIVFVLALILSSVALADSGHSPMTGVTAACSDSSDFIAFNLNAKKIWIGEGQFQAGQEAIELDNSAFTGKPANFTFSGVLQITWGNQIFRNKIDGKVAFTGAVGQTQFTVTSDHGGVPATKTMACKISATPAFAAF